MLSGFCVFLWGWFSRLLVPLVFLRYLWLARRERGYAERWPERLGFVGARGETDLWVHAVSLGEVRAVTPLLEALLGQGCRLFVSCMTPAGSAQIKAVFEDRVEHAYAPLDTPGSVGRFLRRIRPRALMLVEAEFWPTMLRACSRADIPVLLANARITEKSARGYARLAVLFGPLFASIRTALARTQEDKERLLQLGFRPDGVQLAGDLKYHLSINAASDRAAGLKRQLALDGKRPVLVAGSTHEGEEELVLDALRQLWQQHPKLLLLLAPRQPRRFDEVAGWLKAQRIEHVRRSSGTQTNAATQVFVLDSTGELDACYFLADVAFVGGSLVPGGGHNLLEPAAAACPIIAGRHLENFAEAAAGLMRVGALRSVDSAARIASVTGEWLSDDGLREQAGEAGRELVQGGDASLQIHLRAVLELMEISSRQRGQGPRERAKDAPSCRRRQKPRNNLRD